MSPKVPYVDETALEKESKELNDEDRELLSVYHRTFDDDKVSTGVVCILTIIIINYNNYDNNLMIIYHRTLEWYYYYWVVLQELQYNLLRSCLITFI